LNKKAFAILPAVVSCNQLSFKLYTGF